MRGSIRFSGESNLRRINRPEPHSSLRGAVDAQALRRKAADIDPYFRGITLTMAKRCALFAPMSSFVLEIMHATG